TCIACAWVRAAPCALKKASTDGGVVLSLVTAALLPAITSSMLSPFVMSAGDVPPPAATAAWWSSAGFVGSAASWVNRALFALSTATTCGFSWAKASAEVSPGYWAWYNCACGPYCTSGVTEVTTCGITKNDAATTILMIQPQIASPVAVSAGLWSSTVSVKLAIHGVYATPSANESRAKMIASV